MKEPVISERDPESRPFGGKAADQNLMNTSPEPRQGYFESCFQGKEGFVTIAPRIRTAERIGNGVVSRVKG